MTKYLATQPYSFLRARRRYTTDRVWRAFRNIRRAVDRIDRDIELRRTWNPGAELFAFENSGRVILDSLADHDFAADVHEIEHAAHRVAGSCVGCFLVAPTKPAQRIQCGSLGGANKVELDDALDVPIILFWQSQSHEASIFTHVARDDKISRSGGCRVRSTLSAAEVGFIRCQIHPREACFKNKWDQGR